MGWGGTCRRTGRELVIMAGVRRCSTHDHGQGRGHVGCGLLGIPLISGLFWSGSWNVLVTAKCLVSDSRKFDKK